MENIAEIMSSPAGEDIKEETFTSLIFEDMIKEIKSRAPTLWTVLQSLAYTPEQEHRNSKKNPEKVSILYVLSEIET